MVKITKKQFEELCNNWREFKVVAWPNHRKEMYLSELIEMGRDAEIGNGPLQWAIWKYNHSEWSDAFDARHYGDIADAYLKKQKTETDMKVKELVELFDKFDMATVATRSSNLELVLFRDGSGRVRTWGGKQVFDFDDTDELISKLQKKQKDYKSLFSVVDGYLEADFGSVEVTKENALPLSVAKWEFICEELEKGEYIDDGDAFTCALCHAYGSPHCFECPCQGCSNTPFADYASAKTLYEAMKAAHEEVEFLKSLMEK